MICRCYIINIITTIKNLLYSAGFSWLIYRGPCEPGRYFSIFFPFINIYKIFCLIQNCLKCPILSTIYIYQESPLSLIRINILFLSRTFYKLTYFPESCKFNNIIYIGMKLTNLALIFALSSLSLAQTSKESSIEETNLSVNVSKVLESFAHGLGEYKDKTSNEITASSESPILDQILVALKDTELANVVIDYILLSPRLLDVTSRATVYLLKSGLINISDVLVSLQNSGLILQVLHLSLEDPTIMPGVLKIGRELLNEEGIDIFAPNSISLQNITDVKKIDGVGTLSLKTDPDQENDLENIARRENDALTNFMTALKDSGLSTSVIQHLMTAPELTTPAARFLGTIMRSNAISNRDLFDALRESNVVFDVLRDIRHDRALLAAFGLRILDLISRGVIPRELFDGYNS
jgi:hypothetical protein